MRRQEAVEADHKMKQYMQKNKIKPMFSDLVRQLLLKRPENPIEYLITYLDKRPRRLLVCLQGYDDQNRKRLAKIISNKLNFKLIQFSDIYANKDYHLIDDQKINAKALEQLKAVEPVFKGILISGYPNNIRQVDYIQKSGFLPDRYLSLPHDQAQLATKLKKSLSEQEVKNILGRHAMEKKQLVQGLGQMLDTIPINVDVASQIISETLNMKVNKKYLPYDSPRIIIVHPPYLCPPTVKSLVSNFLLHHVNVEKSLQKLSKKQNFKDYVQKYIRKNSGLSKQIELALIQTECKSAAAKNKGYLLSGWPNRKRNLPFIKQKFLSPHLIFVFDLNNDICQQQFAKLKEGDPDIFQSSPKPAIQKYRQHLAEYSQVVDHLKQHYKIQILPWSQTQKQVLKTFQSLIDNPKIYS